MDELQQVNCLSKAELNASICDILQVSTAMVDYTQDVVAAFTLVDGYFSLIRTTSTGWAPTPFGPIHWECRFSAPGKFKVTANTAPLAIARAFLLFKLIMQEDLDANR